MGSLGLPATSSGGSVFTPIGVKSSSVCDRPPCQEKYQLRPSVVTPCERISASWYRKVSVPTSLKQLGAAVAGTAEARQARSARRAALRIHTGNAGGHCDLAAGPRLAAAKRNNPRLVRFSADRPLGVAPATINDYRELARRR